MDCRRAPSAVVDPQGVLLLKKETETSRLLTIDLPLSAEGRLQAGQKRRAVPARDSARLRSCYLNLSGITDLTRFLPLASPGHLLLSCHALLSADSDFALTLGKATKKETANLHILPAHTYSQSFLDGVHGWCASTGHSAVLISTNEDTPAVHWFNGGAAPSSWVWDASAEENRCSSVDCNCGPARVRLLPADALWQPEMVLAAAKEGVDVVVVLSPHFDGIIRLLAGVRTIEQVAVAVCSPQGAGIWMIPEDHQRWGETIARPGESCSLLLDTAGTRVKRFQERVDYPLLLQGLTSRLQNR